MVEAVKWFHKAAEQGNPSAQLSLGTCFLAGDGVAINQVEALKSFRKAAVLAGDAKDSDLADKANRLANLMETNRIELETLVQTWLEEFAQTTFTNKIVTFTNLQHKVFRDVRLVRANALDGIIYQETVGVGGGRVSYTNLSVAFLESLGISSNQIASAKENAGLQATVDAAYRLRVEEHAQEEMEAKALAKKLLDLEVEVSGKVVQVTPDGFLISSSRSADVKLALLSDFPERLVDGDYVRVDGYEYSYAGGTYQGRVQERDGRFRPGPKAYSIGIYKYVSVKGAEQTVRHYTCSRAKAVAYIRTPQLQGAP